MAAEIYYFSGTGNSLHVARELQKRIPETNLIPLVSLLNKDVVETHSETVGFVFPVHMMTVPWIVKSIVRKFDVKSAKYIFAAVTRWGTPCSTAFSKIDKILQRNGKGLDSCFILNMASNDPKFKDWHSATEEEMTRFEKELQNRLDLFQKVITNKLKYQENDTNITYPVSYVGEHIGAFFAGTAKYFGVDFYADAKCSGCGICEQVCLSQKIKMTDQKPVWQKDARCFSCYACLNYCPVQSVQIRSGRWMKYYTDVNGRYFHPEAAANDISGQKRQGTP